MVYHRDYIIVNCLYTLNTALSVRNNINKLAVINVINYSQGKREARIITLITMRGSKSLSCISVIKGYSISCYLNLTYIRLDSVVCRVILQ